MTKGELQKIKEHIEIHARKEPRDIRITQILWKAIAELESVKELKKENEELLKSNSYVRAKLRDKTSDYYVLDTYYHLAKELLEEFMITNPFDEIGCNELYDKVEAFLRSKPNDRRTENKRNSRKACKRMD